MMTKRPFNSFRLVAHTTLSFVLLGAILFGVAAFKFAALPSNTVTLPIEVYAADGFSATTSSDSDETVTINVPNVSAVDSLAFRIHQPTWHQGGAAKSISEGFEVQGSVSIQVNSGSFIPLTDAVADEAYPENKMGGLDDGFVHTQRVALPKNFSGTLTNGDNTITFRFNGTKGVRSGYRVIGIAALGSGNSIQDFKTDAEWLTGGLLSGGSTTFQFDDPSQWTAPSGANVSNGETLWLARNSLTDHINQDNPSMPGEPIVAACSDCHAKDGSDLQYFGYSNKSIIARSRFHGLTQQEGEDIAAYIRSIELTTNEGQTYKTMSWPWEPPYQPGPTYGLDNVNAWDELTDDESHYWAAGAGNDYFLNYAIEETQWMWPDFGGGDPSQGAYPIGIKYFTDDSYGGTSQLDWEKFSMRTWTDHKKYPIQLLFPDWNMWLPDISPAGDFQSCNVDTWSSGGNNPWADYTDLVGDPRSTSWGGSILVGRDHSNPTQLRYTFSKLASFGRTFRQFFASCTGKGASTTQNMHQDQGAMGWAMVRYWEIFQWFDLYDHADNTVDYFATDSATDEDLQNWGLDISFFGTQRRFFDAAPHIMGNVLNRPFHYGTGSGQIWATHAWYQVSVTLDAGGTRPDNNPGDPVDWQYQDGWMASWGSAAGLNIGPRQLKSEALKWQTNWDPEIGVIYDGNVDPLDPRPWRGALLWPKQSQPFRVHGLAARLTGMLGNGWSKWAKGNSFNSNTLATKMATAFYRAWWDGYKQFPISDFQQRQIGTPDNRENGAVWWVSSYVPEEDQRIAQKGWIPDMYYQGLNRASKAGVAPGVIDSIATQWASPMWPQANESNYQSNGLPYSWEDIASYTPPPSDDGDDGGGDGGAPPTDVGTYAKAADGTWISGGDVVATGTDVKLGCNVTATDGDAVTVEFFDNDRSLATVDSSPFEHTYTPSIGAHAVYCAARDADGVTRDDGFSYVVDGDDSGAPATQALRLDEGWNLVSSRIAPDTPALDELFAGVSDLSVVVDEDGDLFLPDEGTNDIGHWTPNEGYFVFMTASETVTLEGQLLDVQSTIPLEKGWNLVTYLPTASLPVAEALASIQDELVMVKDVKGNSYLPDYDIDDIGSLIPGQGYRVFVTSPTELVYPQPSKSASRPVAPSSASSKDSQ